MVLDGMLLTRERSLGKDLQNKKIIFDKNRYIFRQLVHSQVYCEF